MISDPEPLRHVHLFQTMDDDERREVAGLMEQVKIPAGTVLFKENEPGGVLYIISRGTVELFITDEEQKKVVVHVLEPGEFFGEMSLLDGGGRSTAARALEDVEALSLSREPFIALLRRRSDVALDVVSALAKRMRKTDELLRTRLRNPNEVLEAQETFGNRVSDSVAQFGGSWAFIFVFGGALLVWVFINTIYLVGANSKGEPFDPYPFILLNLFLSMLAAIQAPVIMMSQNRQDAKDRVRSELDYQVNLKAELEITQLHEKVETLQREVLERLDRKG
jgi:uncharacterized membrane protein